jgi:predicted nuclease with TOPRIM domain
MVDAEEMLRELKAQYRPDSAIQEKKRQLLKAIEVVRAQYAIVKQKTKQMEEMTAQLEERLRILERWLTELERAGHKAATARS